MKKILLSGLLSLSIMPIAHADVSEDVRRAVEQIMTVYYSSDYDKLRGCTPYDFDNETYCLSPKKYTIKESDGTDHLYVLVSGDTIEDGARATPGLGGLFTLYKLGSSWAVSASNPYIPNGGAGRSQLGDYDLRGVGKHRYGWVGNHCGSGAGGQTNCFWEMYAPMANGSIEQVAQLDSDYSYESMSTPGYTKIEGSVHIENYEPMSAGFYPLTMTHNSESAHYDRNYEVIPSTQEKTEESYTIHFNKKAQRFVEPEGF